jgi:release factor glutamine methyltransferase
VSATAPPRASAGSARAEKQSWNVLELLRWTTAHFEERGIESARLDAECLLARALGVDRLRLYLDFEKPVLPDERAQFREWVRQRAGARVPVAQLLGLKEFWSLDLAITKDVLVPRPETEILVQSVLDTLPDHTAAVRVLEIGTGSGAIALALASELPAAAITATDICEKALEVARSNADQLRHADRIEFRSGPNYQPVLGKRFERVVSNPPYLAEWERGELSPELRHEPERALFAGAEGLDVLSELVKGAGSVLEPGGSLHLELAPAQAPVVAALCREAGADRVEIRRDLAGRPRVVTARYGGA